MEAPSVSSASASAASSAAASVRESLETIPTSVRESLETVPKWKVAFILGAPVAVACALFYCYANSGKVKDQTVRPSTDPKTPKTATVKPQQVGKIINNQSIRI